MSVEGEEQRSSPEELIHSTKPITLATAKAVAAAKSCKQEDMVVAANIGRKAVLDMIHKCRVCNLLGFTAVFSSYCLVGTHVQLIFQSTAANAENEEHLGSTLQLGRGVADAYSKLLTNVLAICQQPNNQELKQGLGECSKNVAMSVSNLVRFSESMKGDAVALKSS